MLKISVSDLESKILEKEDIVVRVRAPADTKVNDYDYKRKAAGTQSVKEWLEGRVIPLINGHEVVVVGGDYTAPHGRTKLDTLRETYEK
jgi:hypothetical protein